MAIIRTEIKTYNIYAGCFDRPMGTIDYKDAAFELTLFLPGENKRSYYTLEAALQVAQDIINYVLAFAIMDIPAQDK